MSRFLETRVRQSPDEGVPQSVRIVRRRWDPAHTAVVICDMWDSHHCVSAAARVVQMAPRIDEVAGVLRSQDALIVHAPGGCMEFYEGSDARTRAVRAHRTDAPVAIGWNDWDAQREAGLPTSLRDPGPCSCGTRDACGDGRPPFPWRRQISSIEIEPGDAVTDNGEELWGLLEERGISDVIVMGVHTNICVLGRPYGIRQLVYLGKEPLLCRDLTDSFHRDRRGHAWGTNETLAHIERYWCPTITSDQLDGKSPLRL